jgi:predicted alpha/beta hydrolase family esterase
MSAGVRLSNLARQRLRLPSTNPYAIPVGSGPVLLVPGLRGSDNGHWQTLWQQERPDFRWVSQADWDTPDLAAWAAAVAHSTRAAGSPALVAAHSFGCLATVRAALVHGAPIRAALLVAPADPDRLGVTALLARKRLPFPSIVVGSTNDPWMKLVRAGELATVWGSRLIGYRNAGHINAESGFGPWPDGVRLLRHLDAEAQPERHRIAAPLHGAD